MTILAFPERPGMKAQPAPKKTTRRTRFWRAARRIWDLRPIVVTAKYLEDVEAHVLLGGFELPERNHWLDRFYQAMANVRFYRPIVMTYQGKLDIIADASTDGLMRGLDRSGTSSGGAA